MDGGSREAVITICTLNETLNKARIALTWHDLQDTPSQK